MDNDENNISNNIGINESNNLNNTTTNDKINMSNENQTKPPKIKKKKKHRFLKFLLVMILIIVCIKVFHIVKDAYNKKKFDEYVANNILVFPLEEIKLTQEELKEDSNSDGISNEDKIKLGLDILSDDTDGDGLSDFDEKGYDINKNYGDSATIKTQNENITLTIDDAIDIEAYYKEYNGSIPSEYTLAMQPFRVYSFTGQIEVKIENPDYYEVISYDNINKKTTNIKSQINQNAIIFNISNDNPILIVYKNNLLDKLETTINSKINLKNNVDSEYILIAMPVFSGIIVILLG